ncbi:hypothetical protein PHLGIDRAFT_115679 [Phlebiopsis gigantea 11061_1 CR5-6]|uniref:F-box domain-containing protein n=1 Tax=Phlebiopsis gigantea (strain 11061_1 CR5-6) TaxID=745531 RepID=A0A0C3SBQ3_PHLG1|nr:hypothetical protein PHLGIDRAFT_115679 [Phlebiopsis gigantea 11061_1 CR5-6]
MAAHIISLPHDIIILLMQHLSVEDLAALCCTCKVIHGMVEEFGWNGYLRTNPRPSYSLSNCITSWSAGAQARYNTIADRNWARLRFIARPLSQRWVGRLQPRLAINSSKFLIGSGNTIYSYGFGTSSTGTSPPVLFEGIYATSAVHPEHDISALVCVPDGGADRTIFVGYVNGGMERISLPNTGHSAQHLSASHRVHYDFHGGCSVEALSTSSSHLLSLSSDGTAALLSLDPDSPRLETIDLGTRSWSCHLRMDASTPYAVFGTTSLDPLCVHPVCESSFSAQPLVSLSSPTTSERPTAVYALSSAPPACAWGASDQIVVSGWFDGNVHVFDLRSPVRSATQSSRPSILPVMSFCDPWSPEAIYSLSCGGGSASHITAGSARHSVLAFWDVRSPYKGWSVHAPGNDSSPVYSVVMDGSRVFGANESRGFVYDFGPGVTEETYPPVDIENVPHSRTSGRWRKTMLDNGKGPKVDGPGFYVTMYKHNK